MGLDRRQALKRMESYVARIEEHVEKIRKGDRPSSLSHLCHEVRVWLGTIEKGLQHVGKKTAEQWQAKIDAWKKQIQDQAD
jgi:hypothetical protein